MNMKKARSEAFQSAVMTLRRGKLTVKNEEEKTHHRDTENAERRLGGWKTLSSRIAASRVEFSL
jgi:hypothetical protein